MSYELSEKDSEIIELYRFVIDSGGTAICLTSADFFVVYNGERYESETIGRQGNVAIATLEAEESLSIVVPAVSQIAQTLLYFNPLGFQRTCTYIRKQRHKSDPREGDYFQKFEYAVRSIQISSGGEASIELANLAQQKLSRTNLPVLRISQQCNFDFGDKNCRKTGIVLPLPTDGFWTNEAFYQVILSDASPLAGIGTARNGTVNGTLSNGRGIIRIPYSKVNIFKGGTGSVGNGKPVLQLNIVSDFKNLVENNEISNVTITLGCGKTYADCIALNNEHNFGGFVTALSEYSNPFDGKK